MPNGIIMYTILIIGEDLIDGTEVLNLSTSVNSTEFLIEDIQAYSNFTVVVMARTGTGEGDPVSINFQTPEGSELYVCNQRGVINRAKLLLTAKVYYLDSVTYACPCLGWHYFRDCSVTIDAVYSTFLNSSKPRPEPVC